MTFPLFKKVGTIERIFLLAALLIVGLIISLIISVAIVFLKDSVSELGILRISQICSQILTFVLPPLLYACLVKEKPMLSLSFRKAPILFFIIGFVMMYAINPLNAIFTEWNTELRLPESMAHLEKMMKDMQESATQITEKMLNVSNISGLIINLIMIAGLAAFGEELLFRSLLQPFLIKICKNVHIGIFLASAIFSFIHFEFYGFLPRLVLGLLLGYMFYYSKSIWVPMLMHFTNNATGVVVYYFNNKGITNIDVENFGETNIFYTLLSIVVMVALFWITIRISSKQNKENQ